MLIFLGKLARTASGWEMLHEISNILLNDQCIPKYSNRKSFILKVRSIKLLGGFVSLVRDPIRYGVN